MAGLLTPELEAAGVNNENGLYDTRKWYAIRNWANEFAQKARA
jgi:hypothetical protein